MEAHGAGTQVLMAASLAIEMGCPIYGVVGLTSTATDKEGRSVPAPGRGIMTTCRERPGSFPSPLLSLDFRRRGLEYELLQLQQRHKHDHEALKAELAQLAVTAQSRTLAEYKAERELLRRARLTEMFLTRAVAGTMTSTWDGPRLLRFEGHWLCGD